MVCAELRCQSHQLEAGSSAQSYILFGYFFKDSNTYEIQLLNIANFVFFLLQHHIIVDVLVSVFGYVVVKLIRQIHLELIRSHSRKQNPFLIHMLLRQCHVYIFYFDVILFYGFTHTVRHSLP